jgi:hypothetical protein
MCNVQMYGEPLYKTPEPAQYLNLLVLNRHTELKAQVSSFFEPTLLPCFYTLELIIISSIQTNQTHTLS